MKFRSWLSTCSSATCIATSGEATAPSPRPKSLISETSSNFSDTQTNSSSTSTTSNSSIQSNLSLLTLPSVPSLQNLILTAGENYHSSATAVQLTSLNPSRRRRSHVNFLAVHNNLLYAAAGNEINVYETINDAVFDTFNIEKHSTGTVKSIAFHDGKVFTAHQDCKIRVWKLNYDLKQHKLISTLPTLEDRLRKFILPHNYVNVRRHKKKLWIQHHDAVSGLSNHEDFMLSISWDKSIKIWRACNLHCVESINKAHDDAINAVAISRDGLIYTGSADTKIRVWKRGGKIKSELIATLEKHKSAVNALALSSDGSILFSGSCDRSILVWEREDSATFMAVTGALRGHAKAILCLINVHDLLLSGSGDRTVRIWRRGIDEMYSCLTVLEGHHTPVRSLAAVVVANGGGEVKVFSGSFDGEIKVWKVEVASVKGLL